MKIHQLNYEIYAIDYLEGTLDSETRQAFEHFLGEHPGIRAEFEEMKLYYASPDLTQTFDEKKELMQPSGKVISWKWAAAASWTLLLISAAFWFMTTPAGADSDGLAVASNQQTNSEPTTSQDAQIVIIAPESLPAPKSPETPFTPGQGAMPHSNPSSYASPGEKTSSPNIEEEAPDRETPSSFLPPTSIAFVHQKDTPYQLEIPEVEHQTASNRLQLPEKEQIALLEGIQKILPEKQAETIAQFNPIQKFKDQFTGEEIAQAFTPEIFQK